MTICNSIAMAFGGGTAHVAIPYIRSSVQCHIDSLQKFMGIKNGYRR